MRNEERAALWLDIYLKCCDLNKDTTTLTWTWQQQQQQQPIEKKRRWGPYIIERKKGSPKSLLLCGKAVEGSAGILICLIDGHKIYQKWSIRNSCRWSSSFFLPILKPKSPKISSFYLRSTEEKTTMLQQNLETDNALYTSLSQTD